MKILVGTLTPVHPQRELLLPLNFRSMEHSLPGSEKSNNFVPWNFLTPGTLAPHERMFQELSLHGNFAPVERSLHRSDVPTTCVPWNFRSCVTFAEASCQRLKWKIRGMGTVHQLWAPNRWLCPSPPPSIQCGPKHQ